MSTKSIYFSIVFETCPNFPLLELSLEKLCVKVPKLRTSVESLMCVLLRSPRLTSLHVSGINSSTGFSPSHLLNTVAGNMESFKTTVNVEYKHYISFNIFVM